MDRVRIEAVYELIKRVKSKDSGKRILEDPRRIKEVILQKTVNGKIPCAICYRIAKELGIPTKDPFKIIKEMKIEMTGSNLDCFE